jgi:Lar family restriction alleviation protein
MLHELPAPCPFCGSLSTPPDLDGEGDSWYVVCPDCGATGPERPAKSDAVAVWNRRVFAAPPDISFGEPQ